MQTTLPYPANTLTDIEPQVARIIRSFAKDAKQLLKDNLIAEYLFGSYARRAETPLSDIDILIIVKHSNPDLQWKMGGLASEYSLKYDMIMSPIIQDIRAWNKNQKFRTLFYQEVTKHGIKL